MMKKFMKMAAVFLTAFFVGICTGKGGVDAKAAVTQADAQKTSLTVTWTADRDAVSYNVYIKEYGSNVDAVLVGNTAELTYTFADLKPATKYYVKVGYLEANGTENYVDRLEAVTLPDKLTGLKQERWWYLSKKLRIVWDKQSAASGFEVKLYDNQGKLKKSSTERGYAFAKEFSVKNNKVYKVQVRSCVEFNGQKYYSSWSTIYCLNQPMLSKVKVSGNKLELKWEKTSGATQYNVYVSTKQKNGYKKVATVSKNRNSCTVKKFSGKKFSPKKTYYVYVEAICNKGGTKNTSGSLYCWNTQRGGGDTRWSYKL